MQQKCRCGIPGCSLITALRVENSSSFPSAVQFAVQFGAWAEALGAISDLSSPSRHHLPFLSVGWLREPSDNDYLRYLQ